MHESLARVPYKEWMRGMKTRGEGRAKFSKKLHRFAKFSQKRGPIKKFRRLSNP